MSFQGPGTGISGYSAQFTVGYANSAGNINGYAPVAGNINGYAPSAGYANQGAATAANIQSAQGINGTSWAWSGQAGTPGWLWGANASGQYTVWQPGQMTVGTANYTNGNIGGNAPNAGYAGYAGSLAVQGIGGTTWTWAGQTGTPSHFWGSNQGSQMYVWQAGQMTVGTANYTNGNIGGYAPVAGNINGYAPVAGNINGYAPSAGNFTANVDCYLQGHYLYSGNGRLRGQNNDVCIYGGQTNFPGNGGSAAIGLTYGNFGRIAAVGMTCYTNNSLQSMYAYGDGYQWYINCDKSYYGENGWVNWWVCNYFLL